MTHFTESTIEQTAIDGVKGPGYAVLYDGGIAPKYGPSATPDGLAQDLIDGMVGMKDFKD